MALTKTFLPKREMERERKKKQLQWNIQKKNYLRKFLTLEFPQRSKENPHIYPLHIRIHSVTQFDITNSLCKSHTYIPLLPLYPTSHHSIYFLMYAFHFSQVKEKKTHIRTPKPPFIDFSLFKSSTVRMFILFSSVASFGIYTPIFFMSLHGYQEGYDVQDLVLLQACLGLSIGFGIVISGATIKKVCQKAYRKININGQHVCQVCIEMFIPSYVCINFVITMENSIICIESRMLMNFYVVYGKDSIMKHWHYTHHDCFKCLFTGKHNIDCDFNPYHISRVRLP